MIVARRLKYMFTYMTRTFALASVLATVLACRVQASAGDVPLAKPTYPLYCQGAVSLLSDGASFQWATTIAKNVGPLSGQCSWPDRLPRGLEIRSPAPGEEIGILCGEYARIRPLTQFASGQYFLVTVSLKEVDGGKFGCLQLDADAIAVTPDNRPWPVLKEPSDGPKPANVR